MDVLAMLNEKMFLGQEFLTWLWWAAEGPQFLNLHDGRVATVQLGDRLTLGPAQGQEGTRVSVAGHEASLTEARQALKRGKLVDSIRLCIMIDSEEFWLTLDAARLTLSGVKLPPVAPAGEGGGLEVLLLERLALIQALEGALDGLLRLFLEARLAEGKMPLDVRVWMLKREPVPEDLALINDVGRDMCGLIQKLQAGPAPPAPAEEPSSEAAAEVPAEPAEQPEAPPEPAGPRFCERRDLRDSPAFDTCGACARRAECDNCCFGCPRQGDEARIPRHCFDVGVRVREVGHA